MLNGPYPPKKSKPHTDHSVRCHSVRGHTKAHTDRGHTKAHKPTQGTGHGPRGGPVCAGLGVGGLGESGTGGEQTWSTWSAVGNLTSRAGELRSAPSAPSGAAGRMIGIGLRAREPRQSQRGPQRGRGGRGEDKNVQKERKKRVTQGGKKENRPTQGRDGRTARRHHTGCSQGF